MRGGGGKERTSWLGDNRGSFLHIVREEVKENRNRGGEGNGKTGGKKE